MSDLTLAFTFSLTTVLYLLGAYLIGSIPFGLLAGKLQGIDIREHGSGNIGATNVFRTLGKPAGLSVFALDFLKGWFPVWLSSRSATDAGVLPVLAAVCAILGHNYPVWLKFKGGKGIATSGGVLLGVIPWALLAAIVIWIGGFVFTRYVSVASILAALSIPTTVVIRKALGYEVPTAYIVFAFAICTLAIWRHRANISRLRAGTENRFQRKKRSS